MKKLIVVTGAVVYALFGISSFIAIASQNSISNAVETYESISTSVQSSTEESYILTSRSGIIVVLDKNTRKLLWKTNTLVSILPKKDKEKIKKGIVAKDREALGKLIEDYCS